MPCDHVTYRSLFAIKGVPALLTSMALSRIGARMFTLALVLYTLDRFGSPALAGWLTFAATAPGFIASPVAGMILDRLGAVAAVGMNFVVSSALIITIILVGQLRCDTPVLLVVLTTIYSITMPLATAGVRTILQRLIPSAALVPANGADTAINAAVGIVGPALAGSLATVLGIPVTLAATAGAYTAATLTLLTIPRIRSFPPLLGSMLRQTLEGPMTVLRDPTLRGLAVSYSLYRIVWGVLLVVVPVFTAGHYNLALAGVASGLLFATMGTAGGISALIAGHFQAIRRERLVMAVGMVLSALATWPIAAHFGLPGLVLGLALVGLASGPIDVALLTLRQRRTDPNLLGRVLSISMSLNLAGTPIGSAMAGMFVTGSLTPAFVIAALAATLGALATLAIPPDVCSRRA